MILLEKYLKSKTAIHATDIWSICKLIQNFELWRWSIAQQRANSVLRFESKTIIFKLLTFFSDSNFSKIWYIGNKDFGSAALLLFNWYYVLFIAAFSWQIAYCCGMDTCELLEITVIIRSSRLKICITHWPYLCVEAQVDDQWERSLWPAFLVWGPNWHMPQTWESRYTTHFPFVFIHSKFIVVDLWYCWKEDICYH